MSESDVMMDRRIEARTQAFINVSECFDHLSKIVTSFVVQLYPVASSPKRSKGGWRPTTRQ